jgi:hypothetical protein
MYLHCSRSADASFFVRARSPTGVIIVVVQYWCITLSSCILLAPHSYTNFPRPSSTLTNLHRTKSGFSLHILEKKQFITKLFKNALVKVYNTEHYQQTTFHTQPHPTRQIQKIRYLQTDVPTARKCMLDRPAAFLCQILWTLPWL